MSQENQLEVSKIITDFMSFCKLEKNLSSKTIKSYGIDLKQFNEHLSVKQNCKNIQEVNKEMIRNYLEAISKLFKPKTIRRKIATLKAMFNYLEYEDILVTNILRKMRINIKEPRSLPKVMNIEEVKNLIFLMYKEKSEFKRIKKKFEVIRDLAIIELLFTTGIRVSELSNLKTDCINLLKGHIRVIGKGNKERIIQICNYESLKALNEYSNLCLDRIKTDREHFFINRCNKRLSEQSIRFMVKKYAKKSGIIRTITPHIFRHSFATLLLEEDVDIKYIQHLLGHSSIVTTQIYTHVNLEKQKSILSQRHPREKFLVIQK